MTKKIKVIIIQQRQQHQILRCQTLFVVVLDSTIAVNGVANLKCSSTACKNRTDSLSMKLSGNLGLNSTNNFASSAVTGSVVGTGTSEGKVSFIFNSEYLI